MKKTRICEVLGIKYPIIQAPMVWITGADLAAAVSNAGGLGTIGINAGAKEMTTDVELTGERLRDQIRKTRGLTNKPFAVNIIGIPNPFTDRCIDVAIEESIPAVVFNGDSPDPDLIRRFQKAGTKVLFRLFTKVTVENARKAQDAGVDAVIVVGYEGGGHSGLDQIPTLALVPQVVEELKIPVIAGGGVANGKGVAAVLALGAEGVYIGTAFIATHECDAHARLKEAVVSANDTSTVDWAGPMGLSRALKNQFTDTVLKMRAEGKSFAEIAQYCYGGDKFRPGLVEGNIDEYFIPLGVAAGMIKDIIGAGELVQRLVKETEEVASRLDVS